jgi:hypothetical protein
MIFPYIDNVGAAWAAELFEATVATERMLVLRDTSQLLASGSTGRRNGQCGGLLQQRRSSNVVGGSGPNDGR